VYGEEDVVGDGHVEELSFDLALGGADEVVHGVRVPFLDVFGQSVLDHRQLAADGVAQKYLLSFGVRQDLVGHDDLVLTVT
jgi:hypothetical protein